MYVNGFILFPMEGAGGGGAPPCWDSTHLHHLLKSVSASSSSAVVSVYCSVSHRDQGRAETGEYTGQGQRSVQADLCE